MTLNALLNIARDGLMAQTAGAATATQNTTNANTRGYVRRSVLLAARPYGGVQVLGNTRAFDRLTYTRVVQEDGRLGFASSRADVLSQVEGLLAPASGAVSERANALFQSFGALAGTPEDPTARADVLSRATAFADGVSQTAADIERLRTDITGRASALTVDVTNKLAQVAELNRNIAEATARGDLAADLRDQRDALLRDIGQQVGGHTIEDAQGRVTLFAAGAVLVEGALASRMSANVGPGGTLEFHVQQAGGGDIDVTQRMTEGTLGGLREARDVDIPAQTRQLDQLAYDVANAVNAVHRGGFGLDGATGRDLFAAPASVTGAARGLAVDPALAGHPDRVAASGTAGALPSGNTTATDLFRLATAPLGATTMTPAERAGAIVGDAGTRVRAAEDERSLRQDTLQQAEALQESASGVSLDEEMVNLTRFQRAFEASSKLLRVADEMMDTLMNQVKP